MCQCLEVEVKHFKNKSLFTAEPLGCGVCIFTYFVLHWVWLDIPSTVKGKGYLFIIVILVQFYPHLYVKNFVLAQEKLKTDELTFKKKKLLTFLEKKSSHNLTFTLKEYFCSLSYENFSFLWNNASSSVFSFSWARPKLLAYKWG